MNEQLNYETCKKRHYELWDFVVNEIKAAKSQAIYIPYINGIKKAFFDMRGYKRVVNLCYACHVAEKRCKKAQNLINSCYFCPLEICFCIHKSSPFVQLQSLEGTMDYDKAIKLAEEIRDSWEE